MTVWVEKIINIFVEVFVINVRADVAVDVKLDVVSDFGVEVLPDAKANVSPVTIPDL